MAVIEDGEIPFLQFTAAAAPVAPAAGLVRVYAKTDLSMYQKDDAGLETVLTGGGGGGGGGGGLVFLQEQVASGSAQLDFTSLISATYDEYLIELVNIVPATSGASLWLRMGTGGGPTYDTGANYTHCTFVWNASGTAVFGANAVAAIVLNYNNAGDGIGTGVANWSYNGHLRLFNPGGSAFKFVSGQAVYVDSGTPIRTTVQIQGSYEVVTAVTALRFMMSTGNIASGAIRVYGIAKA